MTRTPGKRKTKKAREWWICFPHGHELNDRERVVVADPRGGKPVGHDGPSHQLVKVREVVTK